MVCLMLVEMVVCLMLACSSEKEMMYFGLGTENFNQNRKTGRFYMHAYIT